MDHRELYPAAWNHQVQLLHVRFSEIRKPKDGQEGVSRGLSGDFLQADFWPGIISA